MTGPMDTLGVGCDSCTLPTGWTVNIYIKC